MQHLNMQRTFCIQAVIIAQIGSSDIYFWKWTKVTYYTSFPMVENSWIITKVHFSPCLDEPMISYSLSVFIFYSPLDNISSSNNDNKWYIKRKENMNKYRKRYKMTNKRINQCWMNIVGFRMILANIWALGKGKHGVMIVSL